jgi:ATP-dependent DNA ligase
MSTKALLFEPMLCEKVERPPEGPEWCYELKLDGYRAIGFRSEGRVQLCRATERISFDGSPKSQSR